IDGWRIFLADNPSIADLLDLIWKKSGYMDALKSDADGTERIENLEQLYNVAADFDKEYEQMMDDEDPLISFLGRLSLATDLDEADKEENYLTLMTLHAAKGLEFPVVFICGME
ncbi:MAG: 3'-5' exonuclease, partial [Clostridiales bacterium]